MLWANDAALAMHGVNERCQLRYRNNHVVKADPTPIERVVAGD